MTGSRWTKALVEAEWEPEEKRQTPVPEPTMVVEGQSGNRRRSAQVDQDTIFFKDGGDPVITPQSLGYREEYVESYVDVEIWTSKGRDRISGTIEEVGITDYGGLAGEVKRILDKYRIGMPEDGPVPDPGYDVIIFDNFGDEVGEVGADLWRGTWTVYYITYADQIAQEAERRA